MGGKAFKRRLVQSIDNWYCNVLVINIANQGKPHTKFAALFYSLHLLNRIIYLMD